MPDCISVSLVEQFYVCRLFNKLIAPYQAYKLVYKDQLINSFQLTSLNQQNRFLKYAQYDDPYRNWPEFQFFVLEVSKICNVPAFLASIIL